MSSVVMPPMNMRWDPSKTLVGFLLRHGELSIGNKWDGWGDYDLSKEGIESAEKAGQWLSFEKIGRVISSDVPRAMHTVDIVMQFIAPSCPMVATDPNLRPLMVGPEFQGMEKTPERLAKFEYYLHNPDVPIPNGESINQHAQRVQVIGVYLASPYDAKPSLIACHNSTIKSFMGLNDVKEAVTPGGLVACYMNERGEFEFEVVLGAVNLEQGVS